MSDNKATEKIEGFMKQNLTDDEMDQKISKMAKEDTTEWISYGAIDDERDEFDIDDDMS